MAVVLFSLRAKDNLCIKDKEAALKVSFIQRLHCTSVCCNLIFFFFFAIFSRVDIRLQSSEQDALYGSDHVYIGALY